MIVLACKKLKSITEQPIENPEKIHTLDLTANNLKQGGELRKFPNLVTLILDNNNFYFLEEFPILSKLETFSANKNQFSNLSYFLELAVKKFPKIKNLSLVGNPCCPFFEGGSEYEKYKEAVLSSFPALENLDGIYIKKKGMKVKLEPQKNNVEERKVSSTQKEEEENVNAFKRDVMGYKLSDDIGNEDEHEGSEGEEEDEERENRDNGKRLLTVIEYSSKYTKKPVRSMKLRSEGNRFVKNDML